MWAVEPSTGSAWSRRPKTSVSGPTASRASSAFRIGYPFDKWFLAPAGRCSFELRAGSRCFGVRVPGAGTGLGRDVLGWRFDSRRRSAPIGSTASFTGRVADGPPRPSQRAYVRNRYRVLLTRARRGMVIWVPSGAADDPTRDARTIRPYACGTPRRGSAVPRRRLPA